MNPRWMASVARMVAPRPVPVAAHGSDADLLTRFVDAGDPAAFAALVERHGVAVRGVCRARLRNAADADDAAQVVFYVLARDARKLRDRAAVAGWLVRVAHLTALDLRRKRDRRATTEYPSDLPGADQSDGAAAREQAAIVAEELAALPERLRTVLVLCAVEGHSNTEAAAALDCPRGTVDSRLAAAKAKLRLRLTRRGVGLAALAAAETTLPDLGAGTPAAWDWPETATTAALMYAGRTAPLTPLTLLADGVIPAMTTTTKLAAAALLATALATTAGLGLTQIPGPGPGKAPQTAKADKPPEVPKAPELSKAEVPPKAVEPVRSNPATLEVRRRMAEPVKIREVVGLPLDELFSQIAQQHDLIIRFDMPEFVRLYGDEAIKDWLPGKTKIMRHVNSSGMTVGELMDYVIADLSIGSVCIKGDAVVIRPAYIPVQDRLIFPGSPEHFYREQKLGPPVTVVAEGTTLGDVLSDLRRQTGANIIPGDRAAEMLKTPITGTFDNVRLYTLLTVVCNMTSAKVVLIGNMYYISQTTDAQQLKKLHDNGLVLVENE